MSEAAEHGFGEVGAGLFPSVLGDEQVKRVGLLFKDDDRPGKRLSLTDVAPIADLIKRDGAIGRVAIGLIGDEAKPVRALLLDKSEATNWRLGWHQDRTIAVRQRVEVSGFGPWSVKAGQLHVQPPHEYTAGMITLRVHVDAVDGENAPLEILPGSHLLGRLANDEVERLAAELRPIACLASSGDAWAYSTAIVHASSEQRRAGRRRVLQIDFSAMTLPGGLDWVFLV